MRSTATRLTFLWLGCLILAIACTPALANDRGEITGVKLEPEKKNLVISTKGATGKHQTRVIGSPNRLVIDLAGMGVANNIPRKVRCGQIDIEEIRIGNSKTGARIVVDFRNRPVPPYNINRDENRLQVAFGNSLAGDLPGVGADSEKNSEEKNDRPTPLDPSFVPAAAEARGQATLETSLKAAVPTDGSEGAISRPERPQPAEKETLVAQGMTGKPPSSMHDKPARASLQSRGVPAIDRGPVPEISPENARMVREVRPPVTPPTPDPRLLVQEITELKFIQVGHNARLVVRGGDGLDYRMNKVSPTKLRLDLINAEIPKAHQKPLRTDLFSTSVEMIIPGSQTIFVQLKDAVPYQVEKKKGVLMIDFPPPRFTMTHYREGGGVGAGLGGGETSRIFREEQIRKETDAFNKQIERLQKEQEQLQKQRIEIIKKYQVSPDPEVFNKPVTMDFQGISLKNAFRLLAEQAGINIIVGDGVQGTTTLRLFEVPLGQVIDTIINAHNLDREMVGNVMRVDGQAAMKKLKEERQKEYTARIEEVDIRLDNDPASVSKSGAKASERRKAAGPGIRQQIEDYEKRIGRLTQELQKLQEAPVEDTRTEDIGEAGCITLDGEQVCFNYATVRLSYAKPSDIVRTLDCIFNLNCKGAGVGATTKTFVEEEEAAAMAGMGAGALAGAAGLESYSQQLQDQGFSPDSPGYRSRMQTQAVTAAQVQSAQAQRASAAAIAAGGGQRRGVQVALAFGEDPRLAKIIAYSRIWPDEVNRMIFIKDTPDRIAQMKKMIFILDVPNPQILLESRFVVVDRNWSRGLGIIWGGMNDQSGLLSNNRKAFWGLTGETGVAARNSANDGSPPPLPDGTLIPNQYAVNLPSTASSIMGLGMTFGFLAGNYLTQLDMRLQVGESNNKAKVLARPKIQVLNKQKAMIKRGLSIPYSTVSAEGTQTQMINADLKLDVTPIIYPDGRIQLHVKITNNEPVPPADVPGTTQPSIRTREAETYMMVKDGDTAVMGGLLQDSTNTSRAGWPGLMNVPLIGNLFSNKFSSTTSTEMLIFLTPSIIRRPPPAS